MSTLNWIQVLLIQCVCRCCKRSYLLSVNENTAALYFLTTRTVWMVWGLLLLWTVSYFWLIGQLNAYLLLFTNVNILHLAKLIQVIYTIMYSQSQLHQLLLHQNQSHRLWTSAPTAPQLLPPIYRLPCLHTAPPRSPAWQRTCPQSANSTHSTGDTLAHTVT